MSTFEKVTELKKEGASEGDIITKLKAEGINPMEINDALNQAKIKEAVEEKNPTEGMQPSMMAQENETPTPHMAHQEENMNQAQPPQSLPQEYSPQPEQYAQQPTYEQQYAEEPTYYGAEGEYGDEEPTYENYSGTDTMIEVAEQVFSEKMKELSKQINSLIEFKTIYSSKIDDIHDRLRRIENQFDKMQIAILDKVGSYGKNLDSIKKEVNMVEDSFSKMNSRL